MDRWQQVSSTLKGCQTVSSILTIFKNCKTFRILETPRNLIRLSRLVVPTFQVASQRAISKSILWRKRLTPHHQTCLNFTLTQGRNRLATGARSKCKEWGAIRAYLTLSQIRNWQVLHIQTGHLSKISQENLSIVKRYQGLKPRRVSSQEIKSPIPRTLSQTSHS